MSEIKTITLHDGRSLQIHDSMPLLTNFAWIMPDGDYLQFEWCLGNVSEITEEQIIHHSIVMEFGGQWFDYIGGVIGMTIKKLTAKESLLSLLLKNNIDTSKEWVLILKK